MQSDLQKVPSTVVDTSDIVNSTAYKQALVINTTVVDMRNPVSWCNDWLSKTINYSLTYQDSEQLQRDYLNYFLANLDKQNLFSLLGGSTFQLKNLVSLGERTNVGLEASRGNARTDANGIATLTLRFTSGSQVNYSLICQSGKAYTPKSMPVMLYNAIKQIEFDTNLTQTLPGVFQASAGSPIRPTYINIPQNISVTVWQKNYIPYTGQIYDFDVKVVDYEIVNAVNTKTVCDTRWFAFSEVSLINTFANMYINTAGKFSRLWAIVSTGANAIKSAMVNVKTLQYTYVVVQNLSTTTNTLIIGNLSVQIATPGRYQLVFSLNGIESERSGVITITNDLSHIQNDVEGSFPAIYSITMYVMCFAICVVNLTFGYSVFAILGLSITIFGLLLYCLPTNYQLYYVIIMIVSISFILINLLQVVYLKLCCGSERISHEAIKKAIYAEYVYQRLYGKPSNAWVLINITISLETKDNGVWSNS